MSIPTDDRDGLLISVSAHAVVLLLLVLLAAQPTKTLDEDYPPQLTEIEFGPAPTLPIVTGEPQSAPDAAPSQAAEQPEPERPTPPAPTTARLAERRPTPSREAPIPRPVRQEDARPARPNPPAQATQPEPRPSPPTNPEPTQGAGRTQGDASTSGRETGTDAGSGGDAAVEVGFQFGNRSFNCPTPPFGGVVGSVQYRVTFAPSGRYVTSSPVNRNAVLHESVQRVISQCRAEPLPARARQVNQATRATFNFRAN